MTTDTYPPNWPQIAAAVKDAAEWRCEHCAAPHDVASGHVLTVHHLNGVKSDCAVKNLVALCQRCHLSIQAWYTPGQAWAFGKPAWAERRGL